MEEPLELNLIKIMDAVINTAMIVIAKLSLADEDGPTEKKLRGISSKMDITVPNAITVSPDVCVDFRCLNSMIAAAPKHPSGKKVATSTRNTGDNGMTR